MAVRLLCPGRRFCLSASATLVEAVSRRSPSPEVYVTDGRFWCGSSDGGATVDRAARSAGEAQAPSLTAADLARVRDLVTGAVTPPAVSRKLAAECRSVCGGRR